MSEPHTADLGTRYRYRLEGAQLERERIIELLAAKAIIARLNPNRRDEAEYLDLLIGIIIGSQK